MMGVPLNPRSTGIRTNGVCGKCADEEQDSVAKLSTLGEVESMSLDRVMLEGERVGSCNEETDEVDEGSSREAVEDTNKDGSN